MAAAAKTKRMKNSSPRPRRRLWASFICDSGVLSDAFYVLKSWRREVARAKLKTTCPGPSRRRRHQNDAVAVAERDEADGDVVAVVAGV
ncbi:hypothetical protein ACFX2F_004160 [Malus domestica]